MFYMASREQCFCTRIGAHDPEMKCRCVFVHKRLYFVVLCFSYFNSKKTFGTSASMDWIKINQKLWDGIEITGGQILLKDRDRQDAERIFFIRAANE